ncbi:membrane-bound lytic murein transglycosylase MltF [Ferrimonas balearica]|uniref:membrane-bound lytic murein transglycosylase MltF n=1 Tax=Ferrimonas balearica TaxID=44012 RepID=UPI001C9A1B41|nr:membrane-bound lytic murein transglycosylase MltF [Ferrimonas balearica]MBY5922039.1 membrane-bound lytic murein transglycosylase MltF [Ferrimonas balearica]MBY5994621.1 membrane-bound lytic murein transglycosylase MltF [Ferrimonas balearica]
MTQTVRPFATTLFPLLLSLFLSGCLELAPQKTQARPPVERTTLDVGTLYGPTTYVVGGQGASGFDYDLATEFAEFLDVPLKVHAYHSHQALFAAMEDGRVDLMAAALTSTPARQMFWRFGPPLYEISNQLVYRNGVPRPRGLGDLDGTLMVAKGSSHVELLHAAQADIPTLSWEETSDYDAQELLGMVAEGELDYTLADSSAVSVTQRFYPELRVAFNVGDTMSVAWALPRSADNPLFSDLLDFWDSQVRGERLARLEERYFGHVQGFDYVDTRAFIRAAKTKLPRYQPLFERYSGDLDWRKIAAVSYQESHWNPNARSPTGVRGMMMLTLPTAKRMGIHNRLDAEQSIRGGSEYLQQLLTRLPPRIPEEEAIWFAMAAYNIGLGHLEDARVITERHGKDPNSWKDVKEYLPLLRQRKYYQNTRYGFARGDEAAHYVDNIRRYYDTLVWLDSQSRLPTTIQQ